MRIDRLFRATSFRLALLQTVFFLIIFSVAALVGLLAVRHAEIQAVNAEVAEQVDDLKAVQDRGGLTALIDTIEARQRDPSIWEFRLDRAGRRLAGDLPALHYPGGWSTLRLIEGDRPNGGSEIVRSLTTALPLGLRLIVGEDLGERERSDDARLATAAGIAAAAVLVGLLVAALTSGRVLRRVDDMASVVEQFGAGDLAARLGAKGLARSDLDELALALDHMMDRTAGLMEGMRQVTADIAHDLRRPLARHNQQIARVLQDPPSLSAYRGALETATADVDEVLSTFRALLHIAELEAGAPGLVLETVDLTEVAERVVEAFSPFAEEGGRTLCWKPGAAAPMQGDSRLLGQLVANLVENALTHTPQGARTIVAVDPVGPRLIVSDNGSGVPASQRGRIFERFVRLDVSRSTPGTGLGLALSRAIAASLGGRAHAEDAEPGLRVVIDFAGGQLDRIVHEQPGRSPHAASPRATEPLVRPPAPGDRHEI